MDGIYLTAYVIGYIAMYPRIFRYMLDDLSFGRIDKEDILFAGFMSLLITLMYPLIVIGILLDKFVFDPLAQRVMKEYRR